MGCCGSSASQDPDDIERALLDQNEANSRQNSPVVAPAAAPSVPHGGSPDSLQPSPSPGRKKGGKGRKRNKGSHSSKESVSEDALADWERRRVEDSLAGYAQKLMEEGDISEEGSTRRVSFLPANETTPSTPTLAIPSPTPPGPLQPFGNVMPDGMLSVDRCPSCLSPAPARGLTFCPFCGKKMGQVEEEPYLHPPPLLAAPVSFTQSPQPIEQQVVYDVEDPGMVRAEIAEDMALEAELERIDRRRAKVGKVGEGEYDRAENLLLDACETAALLKRELARKERQPQRVTQQVYVASPEIQQSVQQDTPSSRARSLLRQLVKEREHLAFQLSRMPPSYLDPLNPHAEVSVTLAAIKERDVTIDLLKRQLLSPGR